MLFRFIAKPSISQQAGFSFPASNCITYMLKKFIEIIIMVVTSVITRSITLVCYSIYEIDNSIADGIFYPVLSKTQGSFYQNKPCILAQQALHFAADQ